MKAPLVALLIAPDHKMRSDILSGEKNITIREAHRDYKPGTQVMICCHIVPWVVMAEIASVRHCTLKGVTEQEYQNDGFQTQEELLVGMNRFYPHMTFDSPVTVIRWKNVRGFLLENREEYVRCPNILYGSIQHN